MLLPRLAPANPAAPVLHAIRDRVPQRLQPEPRAFARWGVQHGLLRAILLHGAHSGDPFCRFMLGSLPAPEVDALAASVRADGPLVRTPRAYFTNDHALIRSILRDNRFGTVRPDNLELPSWTLPVIHHTRLDLPSPAEPPSMLFLDVPEHARIRRSVARAFTPRAIAYLGERIEQITQELLDDLDGRDEADIIDDYAAKLPVAIIAEMLGLPESVRPQMLEWGNAGAALLDAGMPWPAYRASIKSLRAADTWLTTHIRHLREHPGQDILSGMVAAGDLDEHELKTTALLVAGAGFETTVNLIGNAVVQLCRHRDQLDRLQSDPGLWPNAVEEVLRLDSPVQRTVRVTKEDVEIGGTHLPARRVVALWLGQANRDPRVFADPLRFDVARPNAKDHLAFSYGVHACLGASLARMEGRYALQALFERFPGLHPAAEPAPRKLITLHGYEHIPVRLRAR